MITFSRVFVISALLTIGPALLEAETVTFSLSIQPGSLELKPGLTTQVWAYNGLVPGPTIVARVGDRLSIDVTNQLPDATNIHWHGLEVPNDQDGPAFSIAPGQRRHYEFTVSRTGTYWYHSHQVPVLEQLDRGLYGAFIVTSPEDRGYSGDHVLVLDDWYLDANGRRLEGTARGAMERFGNVETVNGKTGDAIEPLVFRAGELHKLRFINASTAAVHTLRISGHSFRVTHTDGHGLPEPFVTDTLTLFPGERIDAEVQATGAPGQEFAITSDRPALGIRVPISYESGSVAPVASPFVAPPPQGFPGILERAPDSVLELNSIMNMGGMQSMSGAGGSGMGGMGSGMGGTGSVERMNGSGSVGAPGTAKRRWTINGASYPDTEPVRVTVGQVVKLRFVNRDTDMMHPMDHPMHLHGAFFQVVSENGQPPRRETWKDTVRVPAGQYVDVAFVMRNPGVWLLHCHIIDHEDGGMMTTVIAQ